MEGIAKDVFVSGVLPIALQELLSRVEEWYGKMFGVDAERQKLESILSTIQAVLQDAEEKQLKNRQITNWLAKLKAAIFEAEDILDELNYEVMHRMLEKPDRPRKRKVWEILNPWKPYSFSNNNMVVKMKQVVTKFERIAEEKLKFHLTADSSARRSEATDSRETDSKIIESEVVGREDDIRKIKEVLISEASGSRNVSILSIVGFGGLGKTVLAQMVYGDSQVAELFEPRIWVYVSDVFNVPNLLKKIIELAGENCASANMQVLRNKVTEILRGKKFLLVLDDIWTQDKEEWHRLEISLMDGGQGSCVIVTTRHDRVSSIVDPLYVHRPNILSDDDCWRVFEERAFPKHNENRDQSLIEIGRAIVRKCGGLPLAARTLGSLLYGKDEADWRSVMQNEIWKLKDDKILPSLRLSYNHLPQHVKPCFAYCAVFPKGHEMDRETLVQLWMANGFISSDSDIEMEEQGHEIFKELISTSLFRDIKEYKDGKVTCRMHNLVYDLAQSILGNECYILDKLGNMSNKELRHLSITIDAQLPTITNVVNTSKILRTLLFINVHGIWARSAFLPETAWLGTNLRVLDLKNTTTRIFPISVCQMKHLRYLDLSRTDIEVIPEAICNLLNLQTLKLVSCWELRKLPEGMGKLRSLRHLYLDYCYKLKRMPRGMGELRCLRTLTRYVVGDEDGSGSIAQLKGLDLCGKLQLHRLGNVNKVSDAESSNLCFKQNLRFLDLSWKDSSFHERPPADILQTAQEVLKALHPPRSLRKLWIRFYPGSGFPTWFNNLYSLHELSLVSCDGLVYLPVEVISGLGSLKVLKIEHCHDIVGSTLSGEVVGGLQLQYLNALQELRVCKCERLTSFPPNSLQQLTALKKLRLGSCPAMKRLPELPESLIHATIVKCSNITSLPVGLGSLSALTELSIGGLPHLPSLPKGLGNLYALAKLWIEGLPNLTALPEGMEHLQALVDLEIRGCPNLISLPTGLQQRLPSLRKLSVGGCPNLERKFQMGGDYFDLILNIHDCQI